MDNLFDRIAGGFRTYYERPEALILLVAVLAVLAGAGAVLYRLFSARAREARRARRTFLEFSGASGLTGPEAGLLMDVARRLALENPVLLFARRSLFEAAAGEFGIDPARAESLRKKVYGP